MTPSTILLLVLGIVLVVGVVISAVLIPTLRRMADGADAWADEFTAAAVGGGEAIIAGPEPANYRGGTGAHSSVKGNGTLILTDRRLVFRKLTGDVDEITTSTITGLREETTFLGSHVRGQTCLVIETSEPAELGFFVTDRAAWRARLDPTLDEA